MDDILKDLKGESNFAFGKLYKDFFPSVKKFITNNSGNTDDSDDIFQDTMLVLLEKLRQDNFVLTASLKTYVMAISKNLWFKKLRNKPLEISDEVLENNTFFIEIQHAIDDEKDYMDKLMYFMQKISYHCNRLIHDMFFKYKSIDEIQVEYGYATRHSAINQKHKCVEQIRKVKEEEEKKN